MTRLLPLTRALRTPLSTRARTNLPISSSRFSTSSLKNAGSQNAKPGWEGRGADDHAVKREERDVQAEASQSGIRKHEAGEEGSQGLSRKDEGNFQKKAKEEHPEAPGPVIGMNDERGGKGR